MNMHTRVVALTITGLFFIIFSASMSFAQESYDVVIIGNKSLNTSSISENDLKLIFTKKISELNGHPVTIALLSKGNIHAEFVKMYLNRSATQYDRFWKKALFSGSPPLPLIVSTEAEMLRYVNYTEGAIGYVGTIDQVKYPDIRVLSVSK